MRRILIGAMSLVFLSGCSLGVMSPEKVISNYLDASLHGRAEEAYPYISEEDKKVKSLEEYSQEISPPGEDTRFKAFRKVLYSKINFKIKSVSREKDKAVAEVLVTMPDFGVMFQDLYSAAYGNVGGSELDEKEIDRLFSEKYKDEGLPRVETHKKFVLIRENKEWKVSLDWKTEKKNIEKIEEYFSSK